MKILITGASGFIGRNLCANFSLRPGTELLTFDLDDPPETLETSAKACDFALHFAGVNRPESEREFQTVNSGLTQKLVKLLEGREKPAPLVLASSSQASLDNPYGRSKKAAEEAAFAYGERTGAKVYVYRFPNVFGKWCRPGYNSVVATFCHNAARARPLRIDAPEKELTLIYVDDLAADLGAAIEGRKRPEADGFCAVRPVYIVTLGALAEAVTGFAASRGSLTQGYDRADPFLRKLYSTFTSHLPEDGLAVAADMKHDARGYFAELIKSPHFGQISVSRTRPGVTRGNHWHNSKAEKFMVVEGRAVIRFRQYGGGRVIEYPVSGEKIEIIDIPAGYAHAIQNTGRTDVLTVFWAGEVFDPGDPDVFAQEV